MGSGVVLRLHSAISELAIDTNTSTSRNYAELAHRRKYPATVSASAGRAWRSIWRILQTHRPFPYHPSHQHVLPGATPTTSKARPYRAGLTLTALAVLLLGFASAGAHGQTGQWSWVSGSYNTNSAGVYGTLGTPAPGNTPGSRRYASNWTDRNGNFWLFGGDGYDADDHENSLNDLWEFNPSLQEWAWMGGDNVVPCPAGSDCSAYVGAVSYTHLTLPTILLV